MGLFALNYKSRLYETNGSPLLIQPDTAYLVHFANGKVTLSNEKQRIRFADEDLFEPANGAPKQNAVGVLMYGKADVGEPRQSKTYSERVQFFPAGPNAFVYSEKDTQEFLPRVRLKTDALLQVINGQIYCGLGQKVALVRRQNPLETLVLSVTQQFR